MKKILFRKQLQSLNIKKMLQSQVYPYLKTYIILKKHSNKFSRHIYVSTEVLKKNTSDKATEKLQLSCMKITAFKSGLAEL